MHKLVLPILFNSEEIQTASDAGLDYDMEDCIVRNIIFYTITGIGTFYDNYKPTKYTTIYANGDSFVCQLSIDQVEKLIDIHLGLMNKSININN